MPPDWTSRLPPPRPAGLPVTVMRPETIPPLAMTSWVLAWTRYELLSNDVTLIVFPSGIVIVVMDSVLTYEAAVTFSCSLGAMFASSLRRLDC